MAGVEQDVAARVVIHAFEKHLKGDTIVQVFSGVNLEADIYSCIIKRVENGSQRLASSSKAALHQAGWSLRPGVKIWPGEGSRKARMSGQPQVCDAFAASNSWSTAQACLAAGFPCTSGAAKPSNIWS